MICPRCNTDAVVVDSRQTAASVRRRRQCGCGRFTTYEVREDMIESELALSVRLVLESGHLVARPTIEHRCSCGNSARYVVSGETTPRYCGICDITKNGAKGTRA